MMMPTPRFETYPGVHIAGIRRAHKFHDAQNSIREQWGEFIPHMPLATQIGSVTYGAMAGTDHELGQFEYMTGVAIGEDVNIPAHFGRMIVPAGQYAVFTHDGHVSELRKTWGEIWQLWLPLSGYRAANTPDFERYGENFNPQTGEGDIEIWFPVVAS